MRFPVFHFDQLLSRHMLALAVLMLAACPLSRTVSAQTQASSQAPAGRTAAVPESRKAQDALNAQGLTPLVAAASAGDLNSVRSLLSGGASVDALDSKGRTALIAAIQSGQPDVAKVLIAAGADLNLGARYIGSPLNVAENAGDTELAALLLASGAHSTGKSVGDSVCVLPWGGEGFCGTVKSFTVRSVQINVTRIVGCAGGCPARQECSAANPVGGVNGLQTGQQIAVPSWCLTSTGVSKAEADGVASVKTAVKQ